MDKAIPLREARCQRGRWVLDAEAKAIQQICLDEQFGRVVDLLLGCSPETLSSVIVTGLGKSGVIGQKIAATLTSTGTPAYFLHPVEAMHGDLGRVRKQDVVILLSHSRHNREVV